MVDSWSKQIIEHEKAVKALDAALATEAAEKADGTADTQVPS